MEFEDNIVQDTKPGWIRYNVEADQNEPDPKRKRPVIKSFGALFCTNEGKTQHQSSKKKQKSDNKKN